MNMYGHSITQAEHFRDTVASALQHKQLPSSMGRDMDSAASWDEPGAGHWRNSQRVGL